MHASILARHVALILSVAVVSGCASVGGSTATLFADPGKYQFSTCEQLARHRKELSSREQELRMLMERAEQGAGGAIVNVFAYKGDYVNVTEEIRILDSAARSKNCDTPASWQSNSAVR
jgi:hypothetical protein